MKSLYSFRAVTQAESESQRQFIDTDHTSYGDPRKTSRRYHLAPLVVSAFSSRQPSFKVSSWLPASRSSASKNVSDSWRLKHISNCDREFLLTAINEKVNNPPQSCYLTFHTCDSCLLCLCVMLASLRKGSPSVHTKPYCRKSSSTTIEY